MIDVVEWDGNEESDAETQAARDQVRRHEEVDRETELPVHLRVSCQDRRIDSITPALSSMMTKKHCRSRAEK